MSAVKVNIMGSEYVLRSNSSEAHVRRVATHLNARINEVLAAGNPTSTQAAIVLAALNITNELLQVKDKQEQFLKEIEANTERLLERIDNNRD